MKTLIKNLINTWLQPGDQTPRSEGNGFNRRCITTLHNPKGIASLSPGLAASADYPGSTRKKIINPERVAARRTEVANPAKLSRLINTWLQPGVQTPRCDGNGFNRFHLHAILLGAIFFLLNFHPSDSFAATYAAHEWGTFTSVQGSNGELLSWRPLQSSELPNFVFSTTGSSLIPGPRNFSKVANVTLQRMETPVIYFYADQPMNVDVDVAFPKGFLTEWYPQTTEVGPAAPLNTNSPATSILRESRAVWRNLEIIPPTKDQPSLADSLPQEKSGSHYFAARETSASYVRANFTNAPSELEKFIFYRGAGSFKTPLRVTVVSNSIVTVENTGAQPLAHLFLLNIHDGQGALGVLDELASSNSVTWLPLNDDTAEHWRHFPLPQFQNEIAAQIQAALVAEGLFPDEAQAMVNTWKDSWFTEEGVRVLYLLPRPWTDETLPLTLTPQPAELTRVMVGRAEVITTEVEANLFQHLTLAQSGDPIARVEAINELKKLGRFANPQCSSPPLITPIPNSSPSASNSSTRRSRTCNPTKRMKSQTNAKYGVSFVSLAPPERGKGRVRIPRNQLRVLNP